MLTSERKKPKRSKIRYAEYYDLQKTLDSLYADSLKGKVFVHLMELISSEENIRMAYRTIKGNTGSSTAGVDKRTIQDLAKLNEEKYVALIQKQFKSYHPRPVRRVEIPKPNGKTRPLGIPTIVDRIVQQWSCKSWSQSVKQNFMTIPMALDRIAPQNMPSPDVTS